MRKIIVIGLALVVLEELCNTNTLALLHSRVALEDTPALIAEDKVAATVHGIAPRGSFDPKPALWALPHLLLNSKCDKQLVRLIHIAVFRLVLLAAHSGVPGLAATDKAKCLAADGALQLAVILIPGKTKGAPSRRAAAHVVAAFHAPSANKSLH